MEERGGSLCFVVSGWGGGVESGIFNVVLNLSCLEIPFASTFHGFPRI